MIVIPIGCDCNITFRLRDRFIRTTAYPFDWLVTYNGVADIIKNEFNNFLPQDGSKLCCNTWFKHNEFPQDLEQMQRRIDRFMDLIKTSNVEIVFIRKSHELHHHEESNRFNYILKNDIQDAEELYQHLKKGYPSLKFKIFVILMCPKCFEQNKNYYSNDIKIYNITKDKVNNEDMFHLFDNTIMKDLFLINTE